jgi:hypothetical protein
MHTFENLVLIISYQARRFKDLLLTHVQRQYQPRYLHIGREQFQFWGLDGFSAPSVIEGMLLSQV